MEDPDFLRLKRLLEECWSWVLITPEVPEESCLIAAHLRVTGFALSHCTYEDIVLKAEDNYTLDQRFFAQFEFS